MFKEPLKFSYDLRQLLRDHGKQSRANTSEAAVITAAYPEAFPGTIMRELLSYEMRYHGP